jgi:putative hydrolase of the HAD superfamily
MMRDSMRFQLFFDLDRTLWNYEKNVDAVLINLINCFSELSGLKPNEACTKFKSINEKLWVDMQKKKYPISHVRNRRFFLWISHFLPEMKPILRINIAKNLEQFFLSKTPDMNHSYPNAINTLLDLHDQGFKLNVITNGTRDSQERKIKSLGLNHILSQIITSDQVHSHKPQPSIFKNAFKRSKCRPKDAIMIGDSLKCDMLGGKRVGMKTIWFNQFNFTCSTKNIELMSNVDVEFSDWKNFRSALGSILE